MHHTKLECNTQQIAKDNDGSRRQPNKPNSSKILAFNRFWESRSHYWRVCMVTRAWLNSVGHQIKSTHMNVSKGFLGVSMGEYIGMGKGEVE